MKTIWKVGLDVTDEQYIELPQYAELLSVQTQGEKPVLWALVDSELPLVEYQIRTRGTGHDLNGAELGKYLGTYQLPYVQFVGHVFG